MTTLKGRIAYPKDNRVFIDPPLAPDTAKRKALLLQVNTEISNCEDVAMEIAGAINRMTPPPRRAARVAKGAAPCPFMGGWNSHNDDDGDPIFTNYYSYNGKTGARKVAGVFVLCPQCGCHGPEARTMREAVTFWNYRRKS
jgi:hypothetical protein